MKRELLIGAGQSRDKRVFAGGDTGWSNLTTLDINAEHNPDLVWDLEEYPYPFDDDTFDEVHAYEVLEHIGQQGDYVSFFCQFEELWRILKPGGYLCATVPWWESRYAWADPGHRRVITPDTLMFLRQASYDDIASLMMTDYRYCYHADFEPVYGQKEVTQPADELGPYGAHFLFALKAIK